MSDAKPSAKYASVCNNIPAKYASVCNNIPANTPLYAITYLLYQWVPTVVDLM